MVSPKQPPDGRRPRRADNPAIASNHDSIHIYLHVCIARPLSSARSPTQAALYGPGHVLCSRELLTPEGGPAPLQTVHGLLRNIPAATNTTTPIVWYRSYNSEVESWSQPGPRVGYHVIICWKLPTIKSGLCAVKLVVHRRETDSQCSQQCREECSEGKADAARQPPGEQCRHQAHRLAAA